MAKRFPGRPRQRGFTYLGLIILVTVIGMVGAATLKVSALLQRAQAEEELLAIGAAFSDALLSYATVTPKGQPTQPRSLQELLRDPRSPSPRRHLRKIFVDPVTGSTEWGIVYLGDRVGVLAVYSLSQARPLKIGNFDARFVGFENKQHLSEWKFTPGGLMAVPVPIPSPAVSATSLFPAAPPKPAEPAPAPKAEEKIEQRTDQKAEEKAEEKVEVKAEETAITPAAKEDG